jgi:hypothetical protein
LGEIQNHLPVVLIAAVSSRHVDAIDDWFVNAAAPTWGSVALSSPMFDFTETSYYEKSMGTDLKKKLFAFELLVDPADITIAKHQSNAWEEQFINTHNFSEERPINIDPGYLTQAKLVLATTKDRDHRIYLNDGIFAEITLYYRQGVWEKSRWTYPDYQRDDFHAFFNECRDYLRGKDRSIQAHKLTDSSQ